MAGKKRTPGEDRRYKAYKAGGQFSKNKRAKIERHLKKHPEDKQSQEALKNIPAYSRKVPKNRIWSDKTKQAYAQQLKELGYKGSRALVVLKQYGDIMGQSLKRRKKKTREDQLEDSNGKVVKITKNRKRKAEME